jgi:hypothetical protein
MRSPWRELGETRNCGGVFSLTHLAGDGLDGEPRPSPASYCFTYCFTLLVISLLD